MHPQNVEVAVQLDTIFRLLSDQRRRTLLYRLSTTQNGIADRSQLIDAVRAAEAGGESEDGPTEESVRLELHHTQLPYLEAVGVIEYDRRTGTVRYEGDPVLDEWLNRARSMETAGAQ